MSENYDYESLKALAKELGRSVETLVGQQTTTDPFYITPGRRAAAEWFAQVWQNLGITSRTHLRAIHYRVISHAKGYIGDDGQPYLNTRRCYERMNVASQDARYLELIPIELVDDRRGNEPIEYLTSHGEPGAMLSVGEGSVFTVSDAELHDWPPLPPDFQFEASPSVDQRYHVELWCEKSTMNTILARLARAYDLNMISGAGEFSITQCHRLIQRARASGRPVRVLCITDFDPGGVSIPAAVARKIEFFIRRDNLDLDIQVRQIVLTHDQCVEYELPRTPLKETERRAERFEDRFGEGVTELDALEALHPGVLHDIIEREVLRYYDTDLQERAEQAVSDFRDELEDVHAEVIERHEDEREAVQAQHSALIRDANAALEPFREPLRQIGERFQVLRATIHEELTEVMPDPATIDWPEPQDGDEDDNPLFDSRREYVEQIERYRAHRGKKGTERVPPWVLERRTARRREARRAAKRNGVPHG